jgi:hypothetical protein
MLVNSTAKRFGAIWPLLALAVLMAGSDPWFTHIDDEAAIIDVAARPARDTIRAFRSGIGQHEHPPLYDLILHVWLRATGGKLQLLRLPSMLFFLAAIWTLAQAARQMAGAGGAPSLLWMAALWPYGFHYGRLATWYSFSFLMVALLTLAYLQFAQEPTFGRWLWVLLASLGVVYTNYFGWALLACLAVDLIFRRRSELDQWWWALAGTGALLLIGYLPLLMPFLVEVRRGVRPSHSLLATILSGGYSLYCLFVSESVAPWFWALSIPATIAVAACLVLVFYYAPPAARRFLIYFLFLLAVMTGLGIGNARRLLLIAAWLLLPASVTLASLPQKWPRRILVGSLAVVAAIGWFGIISRRFYAASRWFEPWPEVAQQAAQVVRGGGVVVGNSTPFFFYLTYALRPGQQDSDWRLRGLLPDSVQSPGVYQPEQWASAGHPIGPQALLVKGLHYGQPQGPTVAAESWLEQNCRVQDVRRMMADSGSRIKQAYFPELGQAAWRIEIRAYACPSAGSAASERRLAVGSSRPQGDSGLRRIASDSLSEPIAFAEPSPLSATVE